MTPHWPGVQLSQIKLTSGFFNDAKEWLLWENKRSYCFELSREDQTETPDSKNYENYCYILALMNAYAGATTCSEKPVWKR
jgi:hypothetical protein